MEITETFHAENRETWRSWLAGHHAERDEVWLVGYKKETGVPSVSYEDAVKEALCFGWIDSVRKSIDEETWAQRYTPRRAGSPISQTNQERLARLMKAGLVIPAVAAKLKNLDPAGYEIPTDIEDALKAEPDAWEHWQRFSPAYRRIRAAYVDGSRENPEYFQKRLAHLVRKTAAGKQYGYGIEEFY